MKRVFLTFLVIFALGVAVPSAFAQVVGNWPETYGLGGAQQLMGTADQVFAANHTGNGSESKTLVGAGSTTVAGAAGSLTITSPVIKTGTATLASGSATISDTTVDANSVVIVTPTSLTGETFKAVCTTGTGFVVTSSNSSSSAVVGYVRVN